MRQLKLTKIVIPIWELSEGELFLYFTRAAKFYKEMPGGPTYAIHGPDGKTITDPDTHELWGKYFAVVQEHGRTHGIKN